MVAMSSDAFIVASGKSDSDDDSAYMYSNNKWTKIS